MRAPKRKKEEVEISTASLSDIVFLLLIFFLVSSSMNPAKGLGLTLPPPGEELKMDKTNVLTIYINAAGEVLMRENTVPVDQIKDKVADEIKKNDKLVVSLRTDPEARYDSMIQVLDQLKLANAQRISLATPDF